MKKQRIIRCLSALLCLCLLAGFAPAAMAYSNVSDWAKSEVAEMEALGLLLGEEQFEALEAAGLPAERRPFRQYHARRDVQNGRRGL